MSSEYGDPDRPTILHCFADAGTESEILSEFGDVIRVSIDPRDTNESEPIKADAHLYPENEEKEWGFPIREDFSFDLGLFHPVCSRWAATTSISGDPDSHENMIPSARQIAKQYCDHYIIENVAKAPLRDPTILNGRVFGLPIEYKRGFETSFRVPEPPRQGSLLTSTGASDTAETSSFYFSERSKEWWAATKAYDPRPTRNSTWQRMLSPVRTSTTFSVRGSPFTKRNRASLRAESTTPTTILRWKRNGAGSTITS